MKVKIKKLHPEAAVPKYQTKGAAGFDLSALEDVYIYPGETKLVKTGLSMEIPEGYELQIRPRSGMSLKTKIRIANSPGTIDSDYRGEIAIIIDHIGFSERRIPYIIEKGERIAQGILQAVIQADFEIVEEDLSTTERGEGAFGSTNMSSPGPSTFVTSKSSNVS